MSRIKIYITPEEYEVYLQRGIPYTGYVIGLGYSYTHYQQVPYRRFYTAKQVEQISKFGFSKVMKLQKLDTSPKAVLESYGDNLLGQFVEERNGKVYVNMGDGTVVETAKNSEISLRIDDYQQYTMTGKDPNSATIRQVIGNTSDFVEQTVLGERRKKILKNLSIIAGSSSLGLSAYQTFRFDEQLYKATKGPNKGKKIDIYKRTKKGNIVYKNNKPQLRSKQAKWHYTKGKLLKFGGTALNIFGVGIVIYDISQNDFKPTFKQKLDLTFALFAFVPKIGWIVSGTYFLLDLLGVIDWVIEQFEEKPDYSFKPIEHPKTRVVKEVHFDEFSDTKLLDDWGYRNININIPMIQSYEEKRTKK